METGTVLASLRNRGSLSTGIKIPFSCYKAFRSLSIEYKISLPFSISDEGT